MAFPKFELKQKANPPAIPAATAADAAELHGWPVETQRVYVRVLDYFASQGYPLSEAESLTFTTLRVLQQRRGGRGLCLVGDLEAGLARAIGLGLEVFKGGEASWAPERRQA